MKRILFIAAFASAGSGFGQDQVFQNTNIATYGSNLVDAAQSVARDASGDIIVYGTFSGEMDVELTDAEFVLDPLGSPDLFLAKYTSNGDFLWGFNLGRISLNNGMDAGGLVVDPSGEIIISGSFSNTVNFNPFGTALSKTSNGGKDGFTAKYSSNGEVLWVQTFGSIFFDGAPDVQVAADGSLALAFRFGGACDLDPGSGVVNVSPAGGTDAAVIRLNADGAYLSHYIVSSTGSDNISALDVAADGRIAIGASTFGATVNGFPQRSLYTALIDASNNLVWEYDFDNLENGNSIRQVLFSSSEEAVFFTGRVQGSADFDPSPDAEFMINPLFSDPFLARYDAADGSLVWAQYIRSDATSDFGIGLIEAGSAVMVVGSFDESARFDPEDFTTQISSTGGQDIFLAAYDGLDGSFIDAVTAGGSGDQALRDVHFDLATGTLVIAGSFTESILLDLDGTPALANGFSDVFFATYNFETSLSVASTEAGYSAVLFPMPASDKVNIRWSGTGLSSEIGLKVLDINGREVPIGKITVLASQASFSIKQLEAGLYFVQITLDGAHQLKRMMKY